MAGERDRSDSAAFEPLLNASYDVRTDTKRGCRKKDSRCGATRTRALLEKMDNHSK
jgi:hypothetical protein